MDIRSCSRRTASAATRRITGRHELQRRHPEAGHLARVVGAAQCHRGLVVAIRLELSLLPRAHGAALTAEGAGALCPSWGQV
ncbi:MULTISPECIES: hypothetical protein [unclassified Streptomyces]|uniref:hypothetical protein n=1 Tax=unclassified Streptomyces TaxID=2593676 RepID=UPI00093CF82D|nr:hypothetical protein [Streptomyces sp. CB01883]OKJ80669.1 hypothetical protein AMK32_23035 [Streptomyces sp. CB01883]